jgi:hypothetical protein
MTHLRTSSFVLCIAVVALQPLFLVVVVTVIFSSSLSLSCIGTCLFQYTIMEQTIMKASNIPKEIVAPKM